VVVITKSISLFIFAKSKITKIKNKNKNVIIHYLTSNNYHMKNNYKTFVNEIQQKGEFPSDIQSKDIEVTSSDEYEAKECRIMTYEELLQPILNEDDYEGFCGAIACVFDIDHRR